MAGALLVLLVPAVLAAERSATWTTVFDTAAPLAVYKSTDSRGQVTYTSIRPQDSVVIEEVAILPQPSEMNMDSARARFEKIRDTAQVLQEAREQRQADREEAERRRLERLALQARARPQVYERRIYVSGYPLWWPYPPGRQYREVPHTFGSRLFHRQRLTDQAGRPYRHPATISLD